MTNVVKFTAFLVLSSFFHKCYSSSRPRPDDATVMILCKSDEQNFQKKEQDFSKKLREALPRIRFEEGDSTKETFGWMKLYKVQLTLNLSFEVRTIAKELDIKDFYVIPPSISFVKVEYTSPSDEYIFLEELKKADIPVIRKEDWLKTHPIFYDIFESPPDQEYIVAKSLRSEAEKIARRVGVLKIVYEERRPEYVVVKFSYGRDKVEFLKKLRDEAYIKPREFKNMWRRPKLLREYLVHYYAIYRFKQIAKESGISDIVYDMTKLSPVFLTFYFYSDEYEFEEKLKEANIHFEKYEGDFGMNPKVIEYIVEAKLVGKVQEIARSLHINLT